MYFKNFPITEYRQDKNSTDGKSATNILVAATIKDNFNKLGSKAFVDYIVKDEEKPEHIAERVYGKPEYAWIILLSNQIINPLYEWPMSTRELENYIYKKYTGISLFTSPTDFAFLRGTSGTTKLTPKQSSFVVGNTVTQANNSSFYATVKSWDSTLRKLVIEKPYGVPTTGSTDYLISENADGDTFRVRPYKMVLDNTQSLHHFEDAYKNIIDPYTHWESDTVSNGRFNEYSIFDSSNSVSLDFPLKSYIIDSYEVGSISNREYEYDENDYKRNIKLLKVEIFGVLQEQLSKVFL